MRRDENRVVSYFSEEEGYSMARTGRISGVKREVMAERVGFEPTIPVKVCPLSRRIVSTTHAPLRVGQMELLAPHRSWPELSVLRAKTIGAQDFARGLPLRSRPQTGSISTTHAPLRVGQIVVSCACMPSSEGICHGISQRRFRKNACSTSALRPARTPPRTSIR